MLAKKLRAVKSNGLSSDVFQESYVTLDELLSLFRGAYTKNTVYGWIRQGMPKKRLGRRVWFNKDEVLQWLERKGELLATSYQTKKGKRWIAQAYVDGVRVLQKRGFKTKREAERAEAEAINKGVVEQKDYTFNELLDKYMKLHFPGIEENTADRYMNDIEFRIEPFFRHRKLSKITTIMIEEFRIDLQQSGKIKPKSINNCTDTLRQILNKGVKWGYLDKNPFDLKHLPTGNQDYNWWSNPEDCDRFRHTIKGHQYEAAFLLALDTGMRLGEIIGLSKQDVNLELRTIRIHRQWLDKKKRYGPPKGKKPRTLHYPKDSQLESALVKAIDSSPDSEIIFVTQTGKRQGCRKLSASSFATVKKKAGVPDIRFHDLRHTYASYFAIRTGNLHVLKAYLGHADIQATMKYAHLCEEHRTLDSAGNKVGLCVVKS